MILSDGTIRALVAQGEIVIEPEPEDGCFQPSSVDLTLSRELVIFSVSSGEGREIHILEEGLHIQPGEFVLASTIEYIKLPNYLAARLEGKSSLGRKGLTVHATAGYVDPGFEGQLTLEMQNIHHTRCIQLVPGMKVSQVTFIRLDQPAMRPYGSKGLGSKYQGQKGTTEARW